MGKKLRIEEINKLLEQSYEAGCLNRNMFNVEKENCVVNDVNTVKEVKKEKRGCILLGSTLLFCGAFLTVVHPNHAIGTFFALLGVLVFVKMMYWQLVLRLDNSLK